MFDVEWETASAKGPDASLHELDDVVLQPAADPSAEPVASAPARPVRLCRKLRRRDVRRFGTVAMPRSDVTPLACIALTARGKN
jgi:hypothetical protein